MPTVAQFCTTHLLFPLNNPKRASSVVSDLIYTLDPWPLTEPDRFRAQKTHVSMPGPPPSHISTAQYSFLKFYCPDAEVLSNTKSVILGSHGKSHGLMVDRAPLESTIKSIIVPSTNMGYLGSLKKTLNFCTFSDIHQ